MLPVLFPRDLRMRVSHETIYQSLFVQTKGELKRELTAHLRTQRQRRKAQTGGAKRVTLGITDDIGSPRDRPRPRTGPCPGTGRATCCSAASARVRCSPWSSGHPVRAARAAAGPAHRRAGPEDAQRDDRDPAVGAAQVDHLGSRQRDGPARPVHDRDRHPDLLLRPPVAAGSAAPTRTPTVCCASTGPRAQTCVASRWPSATRSPCS